MKNKSTAGIDTSKAGLDSDEQRLWDDLVRSIISAGTDARSAAKSADTIILARRKQCRTRA